MPIEKKQFIKQFAQQALDERISLFLGAGGSSDAGYPNWASLFAPLAKELGISTTESSDYYLLAQYYSNKFGASELRKRINERIKRNEYGSVLIDQLIDIGFSNIWTTNFDNVLEKNYQNRNMLINKVFRDSDFTNIDLHRRINIFKLNGDIDNPNGIIATQSDYENYIDTHKIMLMFFKRELISSTFLFVGYSFTDHLVLECLSEISRYLGDAANHHYTIMKKRPDDPLFEYFIDDLERRYHLRVLLVDNYDDIPGVLKELNSKIRDKKVFVSGSFNSLNLEIEKYSHDLSRFLSKELLDNDYRIVNGIGRRFGTHLIGYANEHLIKQGTKDIDKHLIIRPFVSQGDNAVSEKKRLRESTLNNCGASIFVFGEPKEGASIESSGVFEEFKIACRQNKVIIPISYPNMVSEYIWKELKNNITMYPYLEKEINNLTNKESIAKVSKTILHILESVQTN